MSQEFRALLAGLLSLGVFLGWYYFFAPKQLPISQPVPVTSSVGSAAKNVEPLQDFKREVPPSGVVSSSFENDFIQWELSSFGARIGKALLKGYKQTVAQGSPLIDMMNSGKEEGALLACRNCNFVLPADGEYSVAGRGSNEIVYEAKGARFLVRKVYQFSPDQYTTEVTVSLKNLSRESLTGDLGLSWKGLQKAEGEKGFFSFLKGAPDKKSFVYQLGGKLAHGGQKEEIIEERGNIAWAGIEDRYFLTAFVNRRLSSETAIRLASDPQSLSATLYSGAISIPQGGSHEDHFTLYVGPKERERLKMLRVGLEQAVDYGFFSIFAIPILKTLTFFHSFLKNWGLAIILLTIVVKILLNPLSVKSLKQMKGMQDLQPRLKEIREKYKNDKQRLNLETMQIFKTHKVNPLGGCLPMLIQMPIYIALYRVFYNSIELYHAPFVGFYRDLAAPDPYFIFPVLLGVFMVLQQKLTPSTSADPAQRQMMMMMPVLFSGFMLFLPLGLVLYIFVNTFMSVAQQFMYQRNIRFRDLVRRRSK